MEEKERYKFGFLIGRLNHIHLGHEKLINTALEISDRFLVLIGSKQESKTLRNPFSFETRKRLIEKIYENDDKVVVAGLDDMTNEQDINYDWGRYVLDHVYEIGGERPDLMIYGNDESRKGWFSEEDSKTIYQYVVDRNELKISATELRGYLVVNDKSSWQKYVNPKIKDEFDSLRKELLEVPVYKEIHDLIKHNLVIDNFKKIYEVYEKYDKEAKIKEIKKSNKK